MRSHSVVECEPCGPFSQTLVYDSITLLDGTFLDVDDDLQAPWRQDVEGVLAGCSTPRELFAALAHFAEDEEDDCSRPLREGCDLSLSAYARAERLLAEAFEVPRDEA